MSAVENIHFEKNLRSEVALEDPLVVSLNPLLLSRSALEGARRFRLPVIEELLDEPQTDAQVIDITNLLPPKPQPKIDNTEIETDHTQPTISKAVENIINQNGNRVRAALAAHRTTATPNNIKHGSYAEIELVNSAKQGNQAAFETLFSEYLGFLRLKASNYFLAGGDNDDLLQEAMLGFYKAVRDYDISKKTSFRSFAELCITRQLITAIKTATRFKHSALNTYVSFSHTPAGEGAEGEITLGDALPGPDVQEPPVMVISTEELRSLVDTLGSALSSLESDSLRLYLEGMSYEDMASELGCDTKTIDNALQRVKRKIITHQKAREVLL